jgi:hypothetical protein
MTFQSKVLVLILGERSCLASLNKAPVKALSRPLRCTRLMWDFYPL